jgi:Predicted dinucleotide-binding enzymes
MKNKEVIIVSIPQKNVPNLPKDLFAQLPESVIVIETGNYYPNLRDGNIPALEKSGIDSLWVQEQLGRPVLKVFNSILATSIKDLGRPKGEENRIALTVSGDNTKHKEVVIKLVDELGFDLLILARSLNRGNNSRVLLFIAEISIWMNLKKD